MTENDITDAEQERQRQARMLGNRISKRHRHLRKWAKRNKIEAYRVYDSDIPELRLEVDLYGPHIHITFALHQGGAADDPQPGEWRKAMVAAIQEAVGAGEEGRVFVKVRERQTGNQQYEKRPIEPFLTTVEEGGLKFEVDLASYHDTGLFLDHRFTRDLVRKESEGKHVLNLFAYTGAFTVYAADGGAEQTTTVDLSNTYTDWAVRNLELNGFNDVERMDLRDKKPRQARHRLLRGDTFRFLGEARDRGDQFDLTVVDPPTFSNSKRMEESFDVQRDHVSLLVQVADITAPGGVIYFSSNRRKFKLDEETLGQLLSIKDITYKTEPQDFHTRPHQCWRMVRV